MARWPTGPFTVGRTGCYGCVRRTPADGACGVVKHPCTHRGVDIFASDSSVFAPEGGTIVAIADGKSAPWGGYGPGVIAMLGDSGVYHVLTHLNPRKTKVKLHQRVLEGLHLGNFDTEIAHVHYEVRRALTGPSVTNTMDPVGWLKAQRALVSLEVDQPIKYPTASKLKPFLIGFAVVGGLVGIGWLAFDATRIAARSPIAGAYRWRYH